MEATAQPESFLYLKNAMQPANLGSDEGNAWLARQGFFLAACEAQRGEPDNARKVLSDKFNRYVTLIRDKATYDGVVADYNRVVAFVNEMAAKRDQLKRDASVNDKGYAAGQALTPAQLAAGFKDNAVTAKVLEAQKRGENPDAVYAAETVREAAESTVKAGMTVVNGAIGGVLDGLGWVKWAILGAAGVAAFGALAAWWAGRDVVADAARTLAGAGGAAGGEKK